MACFLAACLGGNIGNIDDVHRALQNFGAKGIICHGKIDGDAANYVSGANAAKRNPQLLSTAFLIMIKILAIGFGGFAGALLRYWISGWVYSLTESNFPIGTMAVNIAGSFILGFIIGATDHYVFHPNLKLFLTIGLLGAFTTFSTFSYETLALIQVSSYFKAFLNVFFSIILGLAAAFLGIILGKVI